MSSDAEVLFNAAMKLSESDRLVLAERLLETVPEANDVPFDTAWEAELERRSAEMDVLDDAGIPWDQLRQQK